MLGFFFFSFALICVHTNNQARVLSKTCFSLYSSDMSVGDEDKKWFRELNPSFWPGQAFSLEIDEVLYHQQSKYQDVLVFKR